MLEAALTLAHPEGRATALSALAGFLKDETERQRAFHEALGTARSCGEPWMKASAFCALVQHLPGDLKPKIMEEALAAVTAMTDASRRLHFLELIEKHAPGEFQLDILSLKESAVSASQ